MPKIENHTLFPNFRYYSGDNKGVDFGIVIVKATYEIAPSGRLLVAEEQAPMLFDDKCHGEPSQTSLRFPSDLVPNKPRTDIIINAITHAPAGKPCASWVCGCGVIDSKGRMTLLKRLRVTGPRFWIPKWKRALSDAEKTEWQRYRADFEGWELSQPDPIVELPLRYELAYGGPKPVGRDKEGKIVRDFDARNPLGRGAINKDWTDHTQSQRAPQIELFEDPIKEPYEAYIPQSLGPIPPAWEPRLPLGGTYDDNWSKTIWPKWPPDYSFAYHNSAHPDLIYPGYLEGDEMITLVNLVAGDPGRELRLPGDKVVLELFKEDGSLLRQEARLDTVMIDVAARSKRRHRVFLSWRLNFLPEVYERIRIVLERQEKSPEDIRADIRKNNRGRIVA